MKVSILTADLSHNCLGRAYLLARLLERNYEVEIIGPRLDSEIWGPLKGKYDYHEVETGPRVYTFLRAIPDLLDSIDSDVILASKSRFESYGVALIKRLVDEYPVILDIDDWETGYAHNEGVLSEYALGIPKAIDVRTFYYKRSMEALSGIADARTVSNRFLQRKFGGELVPHVRDTDTFDPSRFDGQTLRQDFGLPQNAQLVMFSGTPRQHKGVEDLVRAVSSMDRDDVKVVLVGAHESKYLDKIRELGGDSLIVRGQQPFSDIPKWIAAADVIAVPQKETVATQGQLPAKVFDAMAMGKPIVATEVSDLPEILDGCGIVVKPNSPPEIERALGNLLHHPTKRKQLGKKARKKCIQEYSFEAVAPKLNKLVSRVAETD